MQTPESFTPAETLVLDNLETIRALTDPLRLRIVEALVKEARTVKQIARDVGVTQTKLYYHMAQLEEHGLIQVVDSRVVSGIIEKVYRATASSFELDKSLLSFVRDSSEDTPIDSVVGTIFNTSKEEIKQSIRAGAISLDRDDPNHLSSVILRSSSRLTHDRVREFAERLKALAAEFDADESDNPDDPLYTITLAFYPVVPPPAPDDDEGDS